MNLFRVKGIRIKKQIKDRVPKILNIKTLNRNLQDTTYKTHTGLYEVLEKTDYW